jgi:hypothetical protein
VDVQWKLRRSQFCYEESVLKPGGVLPFFFRFFFMQHLESMPIWLAVNVKIIREREQACN